MVGSRHRLLERGALCGVTVLCLGMLSCRPELVVRLHTRVYYEGSVERVVEVDGRDGEGEIPTEADWLAGKVGIRLAEPDRWDRVEVGAAKLRASGFFESVEELPAILSYDTESGRRPDRVRTGLMIEDRVILRRWRYHEFHGDPFSASESAQALDALIELGAEALRGEIDRQFGGQVDPAPAERRLREDGRSLIAALLAVNRRAPGLERVGQRTAMWDQVLRQHGIEPVPVEEPLEYWDEQSMRLLEWSRSRIAEALSSTAYPVSPAELGFWPAGEDDDERLSAIAGRTWGGEERLLELANPHLGVLSGYYGGDDSPSFRFEVRVNLPGRLVRTNGTPDGEGAIWLFREEDLSVFDNALRVESIEPLAEPLTALGVRRRFDGRELLQLADLLFERDPEGVLAGLLERALDEGNLDLLFDAEIIPDHYERRAGELGRILK